MANWVHPLGLPSSWFQIGLRTGNNRRDDKSPGKLEPEAPGTSRYEADLRGICTCADRCPSSEERTLSCIEKHESVLF